MPVFDGTSDEGHPLGPRERVIERAIELPDFTPCAANRSRPCEYTIIVERQFASVQQRNEHGREYTVNKGDKATQVMCRWCRTRKPVE